jgi:hypothetical protein
VLLVLVYVVFIYLFFIFICVYIYISLIALHICHMACCHADGNVLQFENGYLVETVVEGNEIGVVPYRIRISEDGELFAIDEVNSKVVRITPPLSQCMIILVLSAC